MHRGVSNQLLKPSQWLPPGPPNIQKGSFVHIVAQIRTAGCSSFSLLYLCLHCDEFLIR